MKKFSFLFLFALLFAFVLVGCDKPEEDVTYTVEFTGVITPIASQTVKENECAKEPTAPTREMYVFEGWFLGEEEYDFTTPVTGNIKLEAKWTQQFVVKFLDGETVLSQQVVKSGEKVTKPADPEKADATFTGWYVSDGEYDFNAPVTSNLNIVAQWNVVEYVKVSFYGGLQGDVLIEEQTIVKGTDAVAPDASKIPTVEGMEFVRWQGNYTNVQADTKITAKYEYEIHYVKFYVFGEQYGPTREVFHGEACSAPLEEYRDGYEFKGWDKSIELLEVTEDLEVHAIYEAVEYQVKYFMGEVELTNLSGVYTIETEDSLPTVEYTGCEFIGWYEDPTFADEPVTTLKGSVGDKALYAKFSGEFQLLVDPAVATLAAGTEYELDGNKYIVGETVVATVAQAAAAGAPGAKLIITVLAGTYADDVNISKNDTTILGPNAEVDPTGAEARNEEAVITGKVTLAADVDNVTIQGFKFEGNAQIVSPKGSQTGTAASPVKNHENFVFKYNVVNVEMALEETGSGFMVFIEGSSCYSNNTQILNNVFEMNGKPNVDNLIYMDNNEDLKLKDNIFRNIPVDAFYVHDTTKGCSGTDVQITGNTFENIGGSALWLNWVSPTYGTTNGKFVIEENIFSNVGSDDGDWAIYVGSINNGDFIEVYKVANNTFADCTSFIYIHRTHSNAQAVVDGNEFLTAPEYVYVKCPNTSTTADIMTKVLVTNSKFYQAYATSQFVGEVELGEGNAYKNAVVVNAEWAEKAEGDEVEYNGETYVFGTNAYASLAEAASKDYEDATVILVAAGTYNEDFTIVSDGVSIIGAGYTVSGNGERPAEETIIDAVITLAAEVDNVTIQGFKFVGKSQILGTVNPNAGTASATLSNHDKFTFVNNVVAVELTEANNGFIELYGGSNSYETNAKIANNLFDGEATLALNIVYVDNVQDITISDNVFRNVKGNAIYVADTTKGLSGLNSSLSNNTFENIEKTAIWVNWISPNNGSTSAKFYFDGNTFSNVKEYAINVVSCNNGDAMELLSVSKNTFKGEFVTAVKFGRIVKNINYVVEENVFETVPTVAYFDGTNSANAANKGIMLVYNNIYKQDGEVILTLDAAKFIGDVDYKKPEALITYYTVYYDSKSALVKDFLTDFYNWLVEKGNIDATAITLESFLNIEWMNYIGCEMESGELILSEYAYVRPSGGNSETVNEDYFVTSSAYIAKWGKLIDALNGNWNIHNPRMWAAFGMLDFGRWIIEATSSSFYDPAKAFEAYLDMCAIKSVHNKDNYAIAEVPAKEGFVGSWNTQPDGSGQTVTELSATEFKDLTLYAVYTPVEAE